MTISTKLLLDWVKQKKRSKILSLFDYSSNKNKTLHIQTCNLKDQQRDSCILHETNVFDIYKIKETLHFIKKVSFEKKSNLNSQSTSKNAHDNVAKKNHILRTMIISETSNHLVGSISNLLRKQYGMQVN